MRQPKTNDVHWFKSSHSGGQGLECVEAAFLGAGRTGIRDSKEHGGPVLTFGAGAWGAFLGAVKEPDGR
ncbi:DUF397 domain-containing protein [Streptomyces carminius]|uniref:DUF397 domain-containing protein n=1 Tax=Streptomyces carminius TaxID=2665496 RepID=A0A2M8M4P6_9ACTN|nr:DUF397 domain-containing protein [Streptomyces carminius]PJE99181.1 DUF397 domain-containing protein [Streptomyces carminius]